MPIVEAVGISVGALDPKNNDLADRIAEAMRQAVIQAQSEGLSDEGIKARMMAAQAEVHASQSI